MCLFMSPTAEGVIYVREVMLHLIAVFSIYKPTRDFYASPTVVNGVLCLVVYVSCVPKACIKLVKQQCGPTKRIYIYIHREGAHILVRAMRLSLSFV